MHFGSFSRKRSMNTLVTVTVTVTVYVPQDGANARRYSSRNIFNDINDFNISKPRRLRRSASLVMYMVSADIATYTEQHTPSYDAQTLVT